MKQKLPDYIRDDENLRQTLLAQKGFMKYVVEYIMNGGKDGLSLYAQYQEHVYADYRKANTWNGDAQLMSDDEFRLEALGPSNHLEKEFRCRMVFERSISDLPEDAAETARDYYDSYLAYAWRGFFERRNPDHATDVGFYQYFMEQFQHPDGLAYRSMELAVKDYYGEAWTNDDYYDFYRIAEYYYFYFDIKRRTGRLAFDRLRRGVKEWLEGKDNEECRELAIDMLEDVRLFSQTIYNEGYVRYLRDVKYPAEDKAHFALTGKHLNLDCFLEGAEERERKGKWLREQINKAPLFKSDSILFYFTEFVFILKDIAHIWAARLLKEHDIDLHKLEEDCRSFLLPYSPGKDGFDFSYYVDHYYICDSPQTCCVKGRQKAKELLYALYEIKEGDNLTKTADMAELPKLEEREIKEPINERRGGNGKAPRVISHPPKFMTLKYITHSNKEITEKQNERVKLLYEKWMTPGVTQIDGGWGWLPADITFSNFYELFEGKDRKCKLKFKPDMVVLTFFFKCLLQYYIPDGKKKKKLLIEKQTRQSAPQLIRSHFDANATYDKKRLSDTDIKRIKESIYILDWTTPLPQISGGYDTDYDMSDTAIQQFSDNVDLGIDLEADVEEAVMSGELRIGKHT